MTDERTGVSKASLRGLRSKQRLEKMRANAPAGVRVVPATDDYRKVLKHPARGGFPESGSAEWPNDRFTKRRLADGSVTREAPPEKEEKEGTHQKKHTEHRNDDAA